MTARKNRIRLVGALLVLVLSLSLVGCAVREGSADDGRLRVVTTLFPYYDFARAIAGDRADVTLLLAPGREAHSFEPTPLDAVTISRATSSSTTAAGARSGRTICSTPWARTSARCCA